MVTAYEVRAYDSKFTGKFPRSLKQQICQVYLNAAVDGGLLVAVVAVQQQTGSSDCGVTAIANAYHAICGNDIKIEIGFYEKHPSR